MAKRRARKPIFEGLDLEAALRAALGDRPVGLDTLKEVQVLQRALMKREARRLESKLGADHPRVERLQARLDHNLKLVRDLEAELETAKIRVPEIAEDEALVHGRVVSQRRRGHEGLQVTLEDEGGKTLEFVGKAETDIAGYYTFRLGSEKLEALSKVKGEAVFVTVRDAEGKLLHREDEPLTVGKGERVFRDVELVHTRATTGRPAREKAKPASKERTRKKPKPVSKKPTRKKPKPSSKKPTRKKPKKPEKSGKA